MEVFSKHKVSYISKVTNANTIDLIVTERDCTPRLVAELTDIFELISNRPVAIVCAIGSNIGQPGILAKAAQSLAAEKINILAVSRRPGRPICSLLSSGTNSPGLSGPCMRHCACSRAAAFADHGADRELRCGQSISCG